jgi:hypothetical protein
VSGEGVGVEAIAVDNDRPVASVAREVDVVAGVARKITATTALRPRPTPG